jgi:hypothetical protein
MNGQTGPFFLYVSYNTPHMPHNTHCPANNPDDPDNEIDITCKPSRFGEKISDKDYGYRYECDEGIYECDSTNDPSCISDYEIRSDTDCPDCNGGYCVSVDEGNYECVGDCRINHDCDWDIAYDKETGTYIETYGDSAKDKLKDTYACVIRDLDENVGKLLGAADANTYVFFTSDNGPNFWSDGSRKENGSTALNRTTLKGWKRHTYEGGVRVPFIAKGPGIGGPEDDTPVSSMDLFPTILNLAANGENDPDGTIVQNYLPTGKSLLNGHDIGKDIRSVFIDDYAGDEYMPDLRYFYFSQTEKNSVSWGLCNYSFAVLGKDGDDWIKTYYKLNEKIPGSPLDNDVCSDPNKSYNITNDEGEADIIDTPEDLLVQAKTFEKAFSDLYFPSIHDGVDDWQNYITVQAKNPGEEVDIKVSYYNLDGTLAEPDTGCADCANPEEVTIAPNTKHSPTPNFALYGKEQKELFDGTVVVEANRPVIGMTNAIGPHKEAFNIYEAAQPGSELFFSKVFDGKVTTNGRMLEWVNLLQIQNTEDVPVNVTIVVNHPDGSSAGQHTNEVIPAHGKFEIRPSEITGVTPTSGTITVTAEGGMVAGMMKYMYGTGLETESYSIYEANVQNSVSYLPKLYDGYGGNNNYISVLNTNSDEKYPDGVTVTVDLYDADGILAHQEVVTLGENEKLDTTPSYLICGSLGCTNFAGTAVITATAPVYAATNTISPSTEDPREAFNIYEAATPAKTLLFPKLYDGFDGWVNKVSIQNVDAAEHTVTVEFYDAAGDFQKTHEEPIPEHGQFNFSPQAIIGAPFGNMMTVTSDAPNSIAGVVRYERTDPKNSNIRCVTIYEGIAQ